jgi:hypothetical protein
MSFCSKDIDYQSMSTFFGPPCMYFSIFSYFEKIKGGLRDRHAVCWSVYFPQPINFRMPQPIFMKFGMYIMALEQR